MLKGEKAKFTIQSHKAYGDSGSPPKIPPKATLVFEVELISWSNEEDVSEARDHSILKEVLKVRGVEFILPLSLFLSSSIFACHFICYSIFDFFTAYVAILLSEERALLFRSV